MKKIALNGLTFTGPSTPNADLAFEAGLNLVYGASNTGKSFAVKSIDFVLGATGPLPDIEQRRPFECLWLSLSCGGSPLTIARALVGGSFRLWPAHPRIPAPTTGSRVLGQHNDPSNQKNLSQFLLNEIGLANMLVVTNQSGAKRALSFRDVAPFCLVDEMSIQSERSPALSGQYVNATAERSVLKLLLTGADDGALVEVVSARSFRSSKKAKLELIDEMMVSMEADLKTFPNATELGEQDKNLEAAFAAAQAEADIAQDSVGKSLARQRELNPEIARAEARSAEVNLNLQRFAQLQEVYRSDIERLEALEEAGFVLAIGGNQDCPLCGASPAAQKHEHGLGNIERVRAAATAEIAKIREQQRDLSETVQQLRSDQESVSKTLIQLTSEFQAIEAEVAERSRKVVAARREVGEMITARDRVKHGLSLIEQHGGLRARRVDLEAARSAQPGDRPRLEISSTAAHEFAQTVSNVLRAWCFPGKLHVSFDDATCDLKIDGKARRDNGKGVRAIIHAAFKVALLLYCRERNLPHPGFLVLDTPLLTYRDPITSKHGELGSDEKEIAQTSLKHHFFENLSAESARGQFIILENVDPPPNVDQLAHVEVFYGNRAGGRQGLLPGV